MSRSGPYTPSRRSGTRTVAPDGISPQDRQRAETARQHLALVGMDPDDIAEERWWDEMDARDRFDEMGPAA